MCHTALRGLGSYIKQRFLPTKHTPYIALKRALLVMYCEDLKHVNKDSISTGAIPLVISKATYIFLGPLNPYLVPWRKFYSSTSVTFHVNLLLFVLFFQSRRYFSISKLQWWTCGNIEIDTSKKCRLPNGIRPLSDAEWNMYLRVELYYMHGVWSMLAYVMHAWGMINAVPVDGPVQDCIQALADTAWNLYFVCRALPCA